mmetsp:Transcript_31551/g.96999  ORF Transcript_31551/g.96999 Transcript_31551/m.96999 type:complete len:546 (-) Transcript_31551:165-1802(-)
MDPHGGRLTSISLVEAALEAWAECDPVDYAVPERRAVSLLFTLGAHLPGSDNGLAARARRLEALVPLAAGVPLEGPLALEPDADGKVHFLYFWRAFSEIARIVVCASSTTEAAEEAAPAPQGCIAELEQVRDQVLDLFKRAQGQPITALDLGRTLHSLQQSSAMPSFWQQVSESLSQSGSVGGMQMREVTVLLLSWLHDAVMWQESPGVNLSTGMLPANETTSFAASMTTLPAAWEELKVQPQSSAMSPPRPLMASGALVLDLEEHWRAAGMLDGDREALRGGLQTAQFFCTPPDSPSATQRMSFTSTWRPHEGLPEAFARPMDRAGRRRRASSTDARLEQRLSRGSTSSRATASREQSPIKPSTPLMSRPPQPEEPPVHLNVRNIHTAMIPLDVTPPPDALSEALAESLAEPLAELPAPGLPVRLHIYDVSQEPRGRTERSATWNGPSATPLARRTPGFRAWTHGPTRSTTSGRRWSCPQRRSRRTRWTGSRSSCRGSIWAASTTSCGGIAVISRTTSASGWALAAFLAGYTASHASVPASTAC